MAKKQKKPFFELTKIYLWLKETLSKKRPAGRFSLLTNNS
jgi:hypothetical protein